MKRNPLPMREQLNRVVPSGSAEDGARGSAPYMGQGTSPLWVGRAKPCPCGALNYFRLAKSNIELLLERVTERLPILTERNWKDLGACHPEPPPSVARLTAIHSPWGRGSKPSLLPCGNSVGRSIPSRVEINGLRPPLTAFSLLGNPPQAFFPLSLSRSAHLYSTKLSRASYGVFTKCALIYQSKLVSATYGVFCKKSVIASIGKCAPTRSAHWGTFPAC